MNTMTRTSKRHAQEMEQLLALVRTGKSVYQAAHATKPSDASYPQWEARAYRAVRKAGITPPGTRTEDQMKAAQAVVDKVRDVMRRPTGVHPGDKGHSLTQACRYVLAREPKPCPYGSVVALAFAVRRDMEKGGE